jgi:hypothetical protein
MLDKILAVLSLIALFAFCFVLIWWVKEPALAAIVVISLAMAGFDFWLALARGKSIDKR